MPNKSANRLPMHMDREHLLALVLETTNWPAELTGSILPISIRTKCDVEFVLCNADALISLAQFSNPFATQRLQLSSIFCCYCCVLLLSTWLLSAVSSNFKQPPLPCRIYALTQKARFKVDSIESQAFQFIQYADAVQWVINVICAGKGRLRDTYNIEYT